MVEHTLSRKFEAGSAERLDHFLTEALSNSTLAPSRSQIVSWIKAGLISINQSVCLKPARMLKLGDQVLIDPQVEMFLKPTTLEPFKRELNIVYEDSSIIVLNKPPGLTVHPGAGNSKTTLANALLHYLGEKSKFAEMARKEQTLRPGIVHRLDKDTSGLMVVALNTRAHANLAQQFAKRSAKRTYKALVFSTPRGTRQVSQAVSGVVDAPLGRHPSRRKEMAVLKQGGKRAVTHWRVLNRMSYATLLELTLETGRTHQIRVHMSHIGSPLIGDRVYGDLSALPKRQMQLSDNFGRQALHAFRLEFMHPVTHAALSFEAPLPDDFLELIKQFQEG